MTNKWIDEFEYTVYSETKSDGTISHAETVFNKQAANKRWLRYVLKDSLSCRVSPFKKKFGENPVINYNERTLTAENGTVRIRLLPREFPHLPESYYNQQCTRGHNRVEWYDEETGEWEWVDRLGNLHPMDFQGSPELYRVNGNIL